MSPDLDTLLVARMRRRIQGPLASCSGTLLLDAGPAGCWTVHLSRGRARLVRGAPAGAPSAVVRADAEVLAGVAAGTVSGAEAFLSGRLTVRGDLSMALALDGAFETPDRPARFPRARVTRPLGVRTVHLEAGDRRDPAVLMLHGLGATNASLLPLLSRLARDYFVVAPDLPGHGGTDAPLWQYRPDELARWAAALCAELGLGRVAVVGNSLGGRVALELGMVRPDLVERLVLLCPSPAFRRLRQMVPAVRLLPPSLALAPVPVAPTAAVVRAMRLMFARPSRLPRSWYEAGADEHHRVMRSPRHRRAFFACMRQIYVEEAFGARGFWDRLPSISAPALFLWGDHDRLVPAGFARHVAEALPRAASRVLDDCGHVPQFELPDLTERLVREFLDGGAVEGVDPARGVQALVP